MNRRWFPVVLLVVGVVLVVGGVTLMVGPYTVEIGENHATCVGVFALLPSDPSPATDPDRDVQERCHDKAWTSAVVGLALIIFGASPIAMRVAACRPRPPSSRPEPAWFPDPDGSGSLRWWDGHQWTDHHHR